MHDYPEDVSELFILSTQTLRNTWIKLMWFNTAVIAVEFDCISLS